MIRTVVEHVNASSAFTVALVFFALYPLLSAVMWTFTALVFRRRRESARDEAFYAIPDEVLPAISVLVPAYREAETLPGTLRALQAVDYPDVEIVVVDDGSGDATPAVVRAVRAGDPRVRLVRKEANEGKAMAMNDAIPVCRGELIVVVDADARIDSQALRYIAAHFVRLPRVAAVTGNPRVANTATLCAKLQVLEFTSIVSILRRAQVVWGRILTVSGVISAFRRSALEDVGLFDPTMATEDIDVSWRLQRRHYDVRYEPRALIDMEVPATVGALWRQRRRWARGLAQVLRRNAGVALSWKDRRLWPVLGEAVCSILWAHLLVVVLALWGAAAVADVPLRGVTPFPNWWGMLIATACLAQLVVGVLLDRRYDRRVADAYLWAPLYPVGYWLLMSLVTVRSTVPALLRRSSGPQRWRTARAADGSAATIAEWRPRTPTT